LNAVFLAVESVCSSMKKDPYWLRMLTIIVLAMLSWPLMMLTIWIVGKFLVIMWSRRWFAV